MLPNFIIAGERRCGTTTLFNRIGAHPDVYLPPGPDINYFIEREIETRDWRDGEADAEMWERTHDQHHYATLFAKGRDRSAIGHKGADLLFWRPAHTRIARFVPEIKLVITLRNPVTRAWSHYWNEVGKGRETLSFEEALAAEAERSRRSAYARLHLSYLQRGFYAESLEALFRFVPRERVMVFTLEESRLRADAVVEEIFHFIGVDSAPGMVQSLRPLNENWTMVSREWARFSWVRNLEKIYLRGTEYAIVRLSKNVETRRRIRKCVQMLFRKPAANLVMPDSMRDRLRAEFASSVRRLEGLLNRSFAEWSFPK